jgi:hypothetical protein
MPRHDMMNRSFADGDGRTIDGDGCILRRCIANSAENRDKHDPRRPTPRNVKRVRKKPMELTLQNPALIAAKTSPKAKTIVFCMELWGVSREWHEVKGNLGRFP